MSGTHTIHSADREIALHASESARDIALAISRTDGGAEPGVSLLFSEFCPVSTHRPWDLHPREFASVSLTGAADEIRIKGRCDLFETAVVFAFEGRLLKAAAQWTCLSAEPLQNVAVALVLELRYDLSTERVTLPGILYNDNPSADPERLVPHFGREPGACLVCEETRFSIPCANVEWLRDGTPEFCALYSIPGQDETGWSLGCNRIENGAQIVCASGVLAFNGTRDMTYGAQNRALPFEDGYRRRQNGDVLEKACAIELDSAPSVGHAFRRIVSSGYDVLRPENSPCLSIDRVIALKANALGNRWHSDGTSCGYLCVLPGNVYERPPYYLFGWTGQSMRLAWCSARMGLEQRDRGLIDRCRRTVDFYVAGSGMEVAGLRRNYYYVDDRRWDGERDGTIFSRAYGETMADLQIPAPWIDCLNTVAGFFLAPSTSIRQGIYPVTWGPDGTPASDRITAAGIPCVLGLLGAYRATRESRYLDRAMQVTERYWELCGDRFDRPFSGSTLDARCEDKEAGIYYFLAAYELYLTTGDLRFREWAEISADWTLTFVYFWHTGFRPGTLCAEKAFVTTGWPERKRAEPPSGCLFPRI